MVVHITDAFRQWMSRNGCGGSGSSSTRWPSATNEINEESVADLTAEDLKDSASTWLGTAGCCSTPSPRLVPRGPPQRCPIPSASPIRRQAPAEAERRQLTVMFCDLVGSTALSTRHDPEDLRELISAYHRAVADTVARFDGFVAKYMGDGVLIYFGYPQAHEDDAEQAVRAGLAAIEAVGNLPAPRSCACVSESPRGSRSSAI